MIKPDWMILAGIFLLIAVLVNAISSLRDPSLPCDEGEAPASFVIAPGHDFQEVSALTLSISNLNGHHHAFGQVFASLHKVKEGEIIEIYSGEFHYDYIVAHRLLLPEKFNTLSNRMENASWISPSTDKRLTLITW